MKFLSRAPIFSVFLVVLVVVNGEEENSTTNSSTVGNKGDDFSSHYYHGATTTIDDDEFDIAQARAIAYLAKPFALISIICSYTMLREVIADQMLNCGTPITRTLLSMAVADILFSFATFLGMWPIPASIDDPWLIGNVGNQGWCTFQGFIWIFGNLASCFFNASLSILYLLMVRYCWTNAQLRKLEPWQQVSIWIVALAIALYPIPLKLYNNFGDKCLVGCTGDECVHVSDEAPHVLAFTVIPWGCLLISLVAMGLLLCTVRSTENKFKKYASTLSVPSSDRNDHLSSSFVNRMAQSIRFSRKENSGSESFAVKQRQVNRRKSTAVTMQGVCYALAFLTTYLLDFIAVIWMITTGGRNNILDHFAYGILLPSAGTFNFLVFARTRTKMKTPEGRFLRCVMCCSCCPSCWTKTQEAPKTTRSSVASQIASESKSKAKTSVDESFAAVREDSNPAGVDTQASTIETDAPHPVDSKEESSADGNPESGERDIRQGSVDTD